MDAQFQQCSVCHDRLELTADRDADAVLCASCSSVMVLPSRSATSVTGSADDATLRQRTEELGCVDPQRYWIVKPLGRGAQGKVYLARHLLLDEPCVIKTVRVFEEELLGDAVGRLLNEARAGFRINHRNVARVMDCDRFGDHYYFAMEYVDGLNLRDLVSRFGPLPLRQALNIAHQAAEGIHAIHIEDLVHRDIKPANLMLGADASVKIMDLGVVKFTAEIQTHSVTQHGDLVGTPNYMAPEQFEADAEVDHRADIYGLGATIFFLLTGRIPYEGGSVMEIMVRQQQEALTWPDPVRAATPDWLREAVERCLAPHPRHRFTSARELAELIFAHRDEPEPTLEELSRPAEPGTCGVVALRFENLSRRPEDEWIGDAVAEYLNSRLMEAEGFHVADRHELANILRRRGSRLEETGSVNQVLRAARLVGAEVTIRGGVQHSGDTLWITAHVLRLGNRSPQGVANVSGSFDDLLELEEKLACQIMDTLRPDGAARTGEPTRDVPARNLDAYALYIQAKRAFADGDFAEAQKLAESALELDAEYLDPIGLMGASAARLGHYDQALSLHRRQEKLARLGKDLLHQAEAIANMGAMYYYQGEYALAHEFLATSVRIEEQRGVSPNLAKLQSNLGFALMRQDRPEDAEAAFRRAIEISKQLGMLVSLVGPCNGLGGILLRRGKHAEARRFYLRTLSLASESGDRVALGLAHMNLARCAGLRADYESAQAEFDAALRELSGTSFWNGLTLVYEHLAEMHLQQNDPLAALDCIDKRIELARKHENLRMEAAAWEQRARAFEKLSQTDRALSCLKRAIEVSRKPVPFDDWRLYLAEVMKRTGLSSHEPAA